MVSPGGAPKLVVQGRVSVPHTELLREIVGDRWQIETWDPDRDPVEALAPLIEDASVVIGGAIPLSSWPAVPRLKLFQIPWAGYEFCAPETMPHGVPVCNTYEHETNIAEYILLAMLEWQIGLRIMDRRFRNVGWDGRGPGMAHYHGEVRGRTVGIIGYGRIGHGVSVRASAFGMRTIGIRRSVMPTPAELDWLGTNRDLDQLLTESDFVVITCDLNAETRGMIGERQLRLMKPDAVLINIARGAIIEENALYEALRVKRIGGAVIDVWYNYLQQGEAEPWPCNLPFQDLDNIIVSAHESGWTREQVRRRWEFVAANLHRVTVGETPKNIVFVGTQEPAAN